MKLRYKIPILMLVFALLAGFLASPAYAQQPVVHAVLFFSPTCGHCEEVINEDLPPLVAAFKGQLDIVGIDVSQPKGMELYQAALAVYNVPDDRVGVPTLIVGENYLVGSVEIPQLLPGIVEEGLNAGGIDFPQIAGLAEVLAAQGTVTTPQAQPESGGPDFLQKFMRDPVANGIAVIVLIAMIVIVIMTMVHFLQGAERRIYHWSNWIVPVLALLGLGVAGYMSFVETTQYRSHLWPTRRLQQRPIKPLCLSFWRSSGRHSGHHRLYWHPGRLDRRPIRPHVSSQAGEPCRLGNGLVWCLVFHLPDFPGTLRDWRNLRLVLIIRHPHYPSSLGHNWPGDSLDE